MAKTFIRRLWNRIYEIHRSIFRTLVFILRRLEVWLPICRWNRLLSGFRIGFTAFTTPFLEQWKLFCVDWRYGCEDPGVNVYLPALKSGLRHSPFYFYNIGIYFAWIRGTVSKIRAKMFIRQHWKWVYGIGRCIFRTLEFFCVDWRYLCQDKG